MIEIKNLTKIYSSKKKDNCIAINDISFTLPDKGMVFIIGKSGSGKSTLLNLIGGLDDVTSGEILADGNRLSSFKTSDFDDYRSSYIGFIFQDYHLIEDLTIAQNIELSLDITGVVNEGIVASVLDKVGLASYENRFPRELSGGERQRVAIARALAKNPAMILGDEPTGNLDNKTSVQVLQLLKEVSKEKLVVIVSHNLADADFYADRIIELFEGKIISDTVRKNDYVNEFKYEDSKLVLPHRRDLSKEETNTFIKALKEPNIEIYQNDNGFIEHKNEEYVDRNIKLVSSTISTPNLIKLARAFFATKISKMIMPVIFASLLFMLIAMLQAFTYFSPTMMKSDNDEDVILNRGDFLPFDSSIFLAPIYSVTDEDINDFYEMGYEGNIYKLYPNSIFVSGGINKIYNKISSNLPNNFGAFYVQETYGTLNCSEEYLINKFGVDGKLVVLAGEIDSESSGTIITDYIADSIIFFRGGKYKTYEDIIGEFVKDSATNTGYISAIIETGYEAKYQDIIDKYDETPYAEYESLYLELSGKKHYQEFLKEACSYLAIGYSINPNYIDEVSKYEYYSNAYFRMPTFIKDQVSYTMAEDKSFLFNSQQGHNLDYVLEEGEIAINIDSYNSIFGTAYNSTNIDSFQPHKIKIELYVNDNPKLGVVFSKEMTVSKLVYTNNIVCNSDYEEILKASFNAYGLYFDNNEMVDDIVDLGGEKGYYPKNINFDNLIFTNKIVTLFKPFFILILVLLFIALISYLINFGMNNIKKHLYEIGIIKSLGGHTKDIGKIFISYVLLTGVAICLASIIFSPLMILVSNAALINSFENVLAIKLYDISIIRIYPNLILIDLLCLLVITVVSAFVPMLFLHRVKPLEIIRSKE